MPVMLGQIQKTGFITDPALEQLVLAAAPEVDPIFRIVLDTLAIVTGLAAIPVGGVGLSFAIAAGFSAVSVGLDVASGANDFLTYFLDVLPVGLEGIGPLVKGYKYFFTNAIKTLTKTAAAGGEAGNRAVLILQRLTREGVNKGSWNTVKKTLIKFEKEFHTAVEGPGYIGDEFIKRSVSGEIEYVQRAAKVAGEIGATQDDIKRINALIAAGGKSASELLKLSLRKAFLRLSRLYKLFLKLLERLGKYLKFLTSPLSSAVNIGFKYVFKGLSKAGYFR